MPVASAAFECGNERSAAAGRWATPERIAFLALAGIGVHLLLRAASSPPVSGGFRAQDLPLLAVLIAGGGPLLLDLLAKLFRREFGSDLLAGLSIITAALLGQCLAGSLVVLMLSGGAVLEAYASRKASSLLRALAARLPSTAHRRRRTVNGENRTETVPLEQVAPGDAVVLFPHDICPVDGTVLEGQGGMDESYLTGEPYQVRKAPGAAVISGAVNGDAVLVVRCDRPAEDSRYARIVRVLQASEQQRPRMRRLGDQLGALYTPLAVALALAARVASGDPVRFLAVLVVATPCPLLIAIPVAIVGAISLAARHGILIKDPALLETISTCRTALFDKTGTLTFGRPALMEVLPAPGFARADVLAWVAGLERYSRHPLASAVRDAAQQEGLPTPEADAVQETPGDGLRGTVAGHVLEVTSRKKITALFPEAPLLLPPSVGGLECLIAVDGHYAATFRFRDTPRPDGHLVIGHLGPRHGIRRLVLVTGDREDEARALAAQVGVTTVYANQTPEQKLALVRAETAQVPTLFLGDGINDAPALTAATAGVAFGNANAITGEAAGAVILDSHLGKVDVLLHIGRHLRRVVLQSAVGGMLLSVFGMLLAAAGYLPPVVGAAAQEAIDVLAILNALRAAFPPQTLTDYGAKQNEDAVPPLPTTDQCHV